MTATRTIPAEGDRVTVPVTTGYRLMQNRPYECRYGCSCGGCNGTTTEHEGTVERVIYWADNSIESEVRCDDGETRLLRHVAPHGDAC